MNIIEFLLAVLAAILTLFGIDTDTTLHPDLSATIVIDDTAHQGCWQLGGACDPTPWPDHQPGDN